MDFGVKLLRRGQMLETSDALMLSLQNQVINRLRTDADEISYHTSRTNFEQTCQFQFRT